MFEKIKKYQGLLGINARNLLYIKPFNKREAIRLADSKLKTKSYLSARGIRTPRLFAVIRNNEELNNFDFGALPNNTVLKPNRGALGEGILVFKSRKGKVFRTVSNRKVKLEDLKNHIQDILDGRFSINNAPDVAFFEQRIVNHDELEKYSYKGLPDIRIIVYNLIPIMAMLRLPTRESEGKANMAQGAIAVGIDLASGKPTFLAKHHKLVKEIPGVGKFDPSFRIPFFDEMLLMASKTQIITNLGYLACDIAIDQTNGPILLEVNARAGLKVQLANKAPLQKRLIQVADIKVSTPEKGVRVAKDLFGSHGNIPKQHNLSKFKTKIGLEESVDLILPGEKLKLLAKIDPSQETSYIDKRFADKLKNLDKRRSKVKFELLGEKVQTIVRYKDFKKEYDLLIGKRDLSNFLIDVNKPNEEKGRPSSKLPESKKKTDENLNFIYIPQVNLGQVDHQISEISSKIKIVKRLTPSNLKSELDQFKKDPEYNPHFNYEVEAELIYRLLKDLENIKTNETVLGTLFEEKRKELINQVRMLEHMGTPDLTEISKKLYPHPKRKEIEDAEKYKKNFSLQNKNPGKTFSYKEAAKFFEEQLDLYKLKDWKVEIKENMISRCSVNKSNKIFLKKNVSFTQSNLTKLLAHEIETHVLTAENGKKQPYLIFQQGTANYLETQEGLATYNQEIALKMYPKNYFGAESFQAIKVALNHSFSEAYHILRNERNFDEYRALNLVLKTKRGLSDTSKKGGIAKQAIYFRGARKIEDFVKDGGDLKELYIGKIALKQLPKIKKIPSLNPPSILPRWYK